MPRHFVTYLAIALLVVVCAGIVWYRSGPVGRLFKRDMAAGFRSDVGNARAVTEEDLGPLPETVRRYLKYAGVAGSGSRRTSTTFSARCVACST